MELYFKSLRSYFPIFLTFISTTLCTPRKYQSRLIGVQCIPGMSGKYSYFGSNMEHSGTACKSCTCSANSDSLCYSVQFLTLVHMCSFNWIFIAEEAQHAKHLSQPEQISGTSMMLHLFPMFPSPHTHPSLLSGGLSAHQRATSPTTSSHTPSHA